MSFLFKITAIGPMFCFGFGGGKGGGGEMDITAGQGAFLTVILNLFC